MALVDVRDPSKTYQRGQETVPVLAGLNLSIEAGDYVALMGP